ncbi:MAG: hypothetical protein JNM71_07705 [Flavobacterium lindanitolerans]|uniref:hypothetical protein n=1 Tax=Flavobacterium lindanitolerans TaxID=428988 RepID=UPI001A58B8C7|nr:hypothetical protein [Flavobacterium lindanitolerans]MBL7867892.1 hypothetical protein [Flavobacterium lindanitolerans]
MITKEALKVHYDFLKKSYNDCLEPDRNYRNGKNAKIRKAGYEDLKIVLMRVESYVQQHYDLYDLITGNEGTDFQKSIFWDEFISVQYFKRDMYDALKKIEGMLIE